MDIKDAMKKIACRKDGVDHIWVSPFASSQLGKIVSLEWRRKFFIPQLGEFISPNAFVAWLFSGDESERMNSSARIPIVPKNEFPLLMKALYVAKFHQLTSLKYMLVKGTADGQLDLPWMEYKQHTSGVKEHHRDLKRVGLVKAMVKHILESGSRVPFINEEYKFNLPEVKKEIMVLVKDKFNLNEGEDRTEDQEVTEEEVTKDQEVTEEQETSEN